VLKCLPGHINQVIAWFYYTYIQAAACLSSIENQATAWYKGTTNQVIAWFVGLDDPWLGMQN
jgi:hypothetical protein